MLGYYYSIKSAGHVPNFNRALFTTSENQLYIYMDNWGAGKKPGEPDKEEPTFAFSVF